MDSETYAYYAERAQELMVQYAVARDVNARHFHRAFPRCVGEVFSVLDVGAGTCRDLGILLEEGFDAYGVEPVASLREGALQQNSALQGRLLRGELGQGLPEHLAHKKFQGVLCSAVLQHVEQSLLRSACQELRELLCSGGRLFLGTPLPLSEQTVTSKVDFRDENGRIFNRWPPEDLVALFEGLGFRLLEKWRSPDSLGRKNVGWHNAILGLMS